MTTRLSMGTFMAQNRGPTPSTVLRSPAPLPCTPRNVRSNITNSGKELRIGEEEEDEKKKVMYVSRMQSLDPTGRVPLERQVSVVFEDAIFAQEGDRDFANEQHIKYWFTEPEGGWRQELKRLDLVHEVDDSELETMWPKRIKIEGEGRLPLSKLSVGQEVYGEVHEIVLNTGIFVDIGAGYFGWVNVEGDDAWIRMFNECPEAYDGVFPGSKVKARITHLMDPEAYRFPLVLELLEPTAARPYLAPPSSFPVTLREGVDPEDLARETGRVFIPQYQDPEPVLPLGIRKQLIVDGSDMDVAKDVLDPTRDPLLDPLAEETELEVFQLQALFKAMGHKASQRRAGGSGSQR